MSQDILSGLPHPYCSRALFSIVDICLLANISKSSVYREFKSKRLQSWKYGRSSRVRREDLIDWLDGRPWMIDWDGPTADEILAENCRNLQQLAAIR